MSLINEENLHTVFSYHPPRKEQIERIKVLRWSGKKLAQLILQNVPDCPERQQSLNELSSCILYAKAGIENNERKEFISEKQENQNKEEN